MPNTQHLISHSLATQHLIPHSLTTAVCPALEKCVSDIRNECVQQWGSVSSTPTMITFQKAVGLRSII